VWIHDEHGIAYGAKKPILILKDKDVCLEGLPAYLVSLGQSIQLEFDPLKMPFLELELSALMPSFRISIENSNAYAFLEDQRRLLLYGLAGFVLGALVGVTGSFFQKG
jgi:hypothetical protein